MDNEVAAISDYTLLLDQRTAARRVSCEFLKRVRGGSVHWWHVFRHFYYFAATILDRVYLLRGEFQRFASLFMGKKSCTAKSKAARVAFCWAHTWAASKCCGLSE